MSKHNRVRKRLYQLGLTRRQVGEKLTGPTLQSAIHHRLEMLRRAKLTAEGALVVHPQAKV